MTRREELAGVVNDPVYNPLITEIVECEKMLDSLRELPKIVVHPQDPTKQRATPAAKLYKETLQQYTNLIRLLMRASGTEEVDEESPLRKWFNEHAE